jgi:hypothetical protein
MRSLLLLCLFTLVLMVGPTAVLEYQVPFRYCAASLVVGYIIGSLRGRRGYHDE